MKRLITLIWLQYYSLKVLIALKASKNVSNGSNMRCLGQLTRYQSGRWLIFLGHGGHAAMEAEAMPLVNILGLKEDVPPRIAPPAPAVSYSGSKYGATIHVVRNGGQGLPH